MNDELRLTAERIERIKNTGIAIASAAENLKEVADQLRLDVDALALRVTAVENESSQAAENLVEAKEVVEIQQGKQDDRLDTLETNGD